MKQTCKSRQAGYILLSVMLLVTFMLIALSMALPRIAQQIKREKEEELYNRGMDYAMAIRRFVHKTGRYPTSLEQLEDTNHVRFLRKRYKDPMTIDGEWRLVHPGEAQINLMQAPSTNQQGGGGNNQLGGGGNNQLGGGGNNQLGGGGNNQLGGGGNNQLGGGGNNQGGGSNLGTLTIQNIGNGQAIGGGGIMGVASTSKATSIKEFNGQTTYDGWLFVYDPRLEQSGGPGTRVAAPTGNATPGGNGTGTPGPGPGPSPAPTPPPNMPQ